MKRIIVSLFGLLIAMTGGMMLFGSSTSFMQTVVGIGLFIMGGVLIYYAVFSED